MIATAMMIATAIEIEDVWQDELSRPHQIFSSGGDTALAASSAWEAADAFCDR
jgi:hypothetical protein